jgi:hypothetical protein
MEKPGISRKPMLLGKSPFNSVVTMIPLQAPLCGGRR